MLSPKSDSSELRDSGAREAMVHCLYYSVLLQGDTVYFHSEFCFSGQHWKIGDYFLYLFN